MGNHTVNGIKRAQIPASQKFVLWALADCYNEQTGQCNPGIGRLSMLTGLCDKAVRNAIKGLQDGGWIAVSGSRAARHYQLVKWMPDKEDWTHGPGQSGPILRSQEPASRTDTETLAPARDTDKTENDRYVVPSGSVPDTGSSGISYRTTGTTCRQKQKETEWETGMETQYSPPAAAGRDDHRHHEITSRWGKEYQEVCGYAYVFQGRDASGLKRFLERASEVSSGDFLKLARAAWKLSQQKGYYPASRQALTIAGLCGNWNHVRGEVKRGPQTQGSRGATGSDATDRYQARPAYTDTLPQL